MSTLSTASDAEAPQLPDCCNDPLTAAATGQPCKSGSVCGLPLVACLGAMPATVIDPAVDAAALPVRAAHGPPPPTLPWRPPATR